jgi:hypothetical protein
MKTITFPVIAAILGLWGADAKEFDIGVSFPYIDGRTGCSNDEIARIDHHVRQTLKDLGYADIAHSKGWEVLDDGITESMDAILESTEAGLERKLGSCSSRLLCLSGALWYCQYCSCGCGTWRRSMLRVLKKEGEDLPDAVEKIRGNLKAETTNDRKILCVDTQSPEIVTLPVSV